MRDITQLMMKPYFTIETIDFAINTNCVNWKKIYRILETIETKRLTISGRHLTKAKSKNIVNSLVKNSHLRHLSIYTYMCDPVDSLYNPVGLCGALKNPHILTFTVTYDEGNCDNLAKLLKCYPHVRLSMIRLMPEKENSHLYSYIFTRCDNVTINGRNIHQLSYLPCPHQVHELKYSQTELAHLHKWLNLMPNLTELTLDGNLNSETASQVENVDKLRDAIRDHPSLNRITLSSFRGRIEEILRFRPFTRVVLQFCSVTPEVMAALSENTHLEALALLIGTDRTLSITDILSSLAFSSLQELSIFSERLSVKDWMLLSILEKRGLKRLSCSFDGGTGTTRFLKSLTNLRVLSMMLVKNLDCFGRIAEILRNNRSLHGFELSCTHRKFSEAQIFRVLEENTVIQQISPIIHNTMKHLFDRNRRGWCPENHHLFPPRIRKQVKSFLDIQIIRVYYLPPELLFQIFRYLI